MHAPDTSSEKEPGADGARAPRAARSRRRALAAALAGRATPIVAVLLLVGGAALSALETPLWWFGGALLAAGATLCWRIAVERGGALRERLSQPRALLGLRVTPLRALIEIACAAAIVYVGSVMMADLAGGERPVSHDHTVHFAKALFLHEHLLPEGKLFGWSHNWFAGYPANYLYPPGADLWVNAVHALCFGALSFSAAYGVAFWLFHVFSGFAVYRLGRMVGGSATGLIAALLCLTDMSDFRMGGWAYTVDYGVWPQSLSLAFSLMALCSLPGIAAGTRLAPLASYGIWMGLAIITHPIQLIALGLLLICTALAAGFAEDVRAPRAVFRLLLAYALSVFVALLWLIPFLSCRGETNQMGVWWDTTYEMGKGLLELNALPGTLGYVLAFGVLAVAIMLRTRSFLLLFIAFTALCIPAISNSTFVDEFHLPELSPAFAKVQFVRLSTMVKPFWFVLAGYFAVAVLRHARKLTLTRAAGEGVRPIESHARAALLSGLVGLLVLPVLVETAQVFWTRNVRKALVTETDRALLEDRHRLEHWLKKELPKDGFYRVGVFTGHNHDLLDLAALIDRPIWKRGFTPASNFIYQAGEVDPELFAAVNLRFAISKQALAPEDFDKVADFGRYQMYRFKRWQPNPFTVLTGQGDVKLERFSNEEVVLRAAPGAHGTLRLNVSYFSRWHAYRDGRAVPITITYLRNSPDDTGFITVPLEPGTYRFAFERTLGDRLAVPLGLCGLLLCALLLWADRREGRLAWLKRALAAVEARLDRLSEPRWHRARIALACALSLGIVAGGVALARFRPPLDLHELGPFAVSRVRFDFLEGLDKARAEIVYPESTQRCLRQKGHHVCRDDLGNLDNERYVASSPATIEEYTMVRCIRARPEQNAVLRISYPDVRLGQAIVGYFGIERAGRMMNRRRPVVFDIEVDGRRIYTGQTESDNQMYWFRADVPQSQGNRGKVVFSVHADNVQKRFFCFDAQAVNLK